MADELHGTKDPRIVLAGWALQLIVEAIRAEPGRLARFLDMAERDIKPAKFAREGVTPA